MDKILRVILKLRESRCGSPNTNIDVEKHGVASTKVHGGNALIVRDAE